ncbi:putative polysaccharide biosynthesis protein [Anaerosacchariphilus polymeriproducens]|uniref:Polysaccharide biosynthesis protein n=1 Tax=Anaerosacchariphilus polymeriproducens TaxID=1812858 RepID=A0A371AU35_9FIRM|nr:polysaccharide biosynthesis protein [Anaerosacchariphilus polymeriproducens]RDU23073.1 polysaccharide biosynthesis protein [Anaerosacchariphilus polymeriproducens]
MSSKKKKKSNFLVQGSILAISSIIVRIIGAVYRIPLTKIIGDIGNDYYSNAYEIYNLLLLISSYSLPLAVSKLVSARLAKGERKNAYRIFRGALVFAIISGIVVATFTFVFSRFLTARLFNTPMSFFALRALIPALIIVAILGVLRGFFQGNGTMIPTAISQIAEQIINAIVSVGAAYFLFSYGKKIGAVLGDAKSYSAAYGAAGGTLGTGAGALTALVFMLMIFFMYRPVLKRQIRRDRYSKKESYRKIFYVLMMTIVPVILSTTVYNISGILDQGIFKSPMLQHGLSADVRSQMWGIFSGKYKVLTNVPIAIASAVASSVTPGLSIAVALGDKNEMKAKIETAIRFVMIVAFPCAIGMGVLASPILHFLFNGSSTESMTIATRLLQSGAVVIIFTSLSTLSNGLLQGINRMKTPVINAVISLIIHLISLIIMLQFFNLKIYAVIYSNIIFAFLMCLLNGMAIRKFIGYKQEIKRSFIIPCISSILMGVVVYLVYSGIHKGLDNNKLGVVISIILGALVYGILLLAFKALTEEEIKRLPKGNLILSFGKKIHLIK